MTKSEAATALEGQKPEQHARTLEAEEFRLVDRAGRLRAAIEMADCGPRLTMMREDGTTALELLLTADGACVRLTDNAGKTRLFLGSTRGTARIGMSDGEGAQRLMMGLGAEGAPLLTFYDEAQRRTWTTRRPRRPKHAEKRSRPAKPRSPR